MRKPILIKIELIQNFKSKDDKNILLSLGNQNKSYKNSNEAKKDLNVQTADEAYEILRNNYNNDVKESNKRFKTLYDVKNKEYKEYVNKKDFKKLPYIEKSKLITDEKEEKMKSRTQRKMMYNLSTQNNLFLLNIPENLNKCLQAIQEQNDIDTMYSFRNLFTKQNTNNKVNSYSFEVNSIQDIKNKLIELYKRQKNAFKISIQFGFVFEILLDDGDVKYKAFNATKNKFYKEAILITNLKQLNNLMSSFNLEDILKYIDNMRPTTSHKTIAITTLDVKLFDMNYRIGANIELPDYIIKNQNINSMCDSTNNMCFWNCLAFHKTKERKCFTQGKYYFEEFYKKKPNKSYLGFDIYNELEKFEKQFNIGVCIFELNETNTLIEVRHSFIEDDKMNLLLFKNHFSYIRDLSIIEKTKYKCDKCGHLFEDITHLKRHNCKDFVKKDSFVKYPQVYEPERNLIITLNEIFGTNCDFKYEPIIVFDFESKLTKLDKLITKNMTLINKHEVISVSICSNIEGYENELFLVNENPKVLINEMFQVFNNITKKITDIMREKYQILYDKIHQITNVNTKKRYLTRLEDYVVQVPILGFNSGMYDINININEFINELKNEIACENSKITAIKNGNSYKALIAGKYKFLDVCQYIPPDYNLDKYVKAFNPNGMKKSVFPYEYIDNYERLNDDINILTRNHFFSTLKNKGITDEEWEEFTNNKTKYQWKTVMDLLKYYNNLDVKPFLEAVLNHRKFFYNMNIDMFKDGFSLPALAEKIMFYYELKEFNEDFIKKQLKYNNKVDIYDNIKTKLQGYKIQDNGNNIFVESKFIKQNEVKNIIFNQGGKCLYCWKKCENDTWSLDRINNDFGHNSDNCVLSCVKCNVQRSDSLYSIFYRTKALQRYSYNHPLVYLINEENKEVFYKLKQNITGGASIVFHRYHEADETRIKKPIFENGEWKEGKEGKLVKNITGFDANALYLWCIGQDMLCGTLKYEEGDNFDIEKDFGMVEVDIETPIDLYNEMGEFPLIFKNAEYDPNEIMGDYMKSVYEDSKIPKKTKKLISSFKGEKVLIKSDRLKWLISKGLKVTKIYGYIKAQRGKVFKEFTEQVSNFRRLGDKDPKFGIIAEMWKLVGNSAFGRTGMNKNKFYNTIFGDENKYDKEVSSFLFRDANQFGEVFEITKDKMKTRQNIPIQVACSIYDDSKFKMSAFYYDCVSKYLSKDDFQYIEMDTDSAYMALTGNFEDLIKPDMKDEFLKDRNNWFLRNDTKENSNFDKRVPGLFKPEFIGKGIVANCSKSYYVKGFDNYDKLSCKGIQKSNNDLNFELYKDVLLKNTPHIVKNKGFRILNEKQTSNEIIIVDNKERWINNNKDKTQIGRAIYMYEVVKTGITQKYDKRRVLNDKVSTVPLDI